MQYKVHVEDPSTRKGARRYTVSEQVFQALRDADDQLVRITEDGDASEEWIDRHRIIRVMRVN
jgi:hypothetical protein